MFQVIIISENGRDTLPKVHEYSEAKKQILDYCEAQKLEAAEYNEEHLQWVYGFEIVDLDTNYTWVYNTKVEKIDENDYLTESN